MWPEAESFLRRAQLTEWMDEPCSYAEFRACLRDLTQVNRMVFSYRPTLRWLEQFALRGREPLHIVDVGSGAGDMLRRIEAWARKRGVAVRLTGIDLNPHAARAAREFTGSDSRIEWVTGGAFEYKPPAGIDLVISSLFTHHLADAEIVSFLQWMEYTAARGWFINDLRRSERSYHAFRLLAYGMRWHRFVRHDGPVSIQRSFSEEDWRVYAQRAGLNAGAMQIAGEWPGRLCVARVKG
ncbi:MAG: methyltransferase domain-containing protein [Acidobacteriota bacterium]|nr:methyltransferase domain-containing protein [Acidobacteriota bacterium]